MFPSFHVIVGIAWAVIIGFFAILSDYNTDATSGDYSMFQDVHVMIFIGFGLLMSFLVNASFTATGHSLAVAAFTVVWSMVNQWFFGDVLLGNSNKGFRIGVDALVDADFAAGAVLISFGALIGRLSLLQLLAMAAIEVVFYSINAAVGYGRFAAADIGGSMIIHTFGAYFGLTVSLLLDRSKERKEKRAPKWASDHTSDTFAMAGTLFLWCFWPSFNAYYGGQINGGGVGERVVVNTYLSLCGSVVATFVVSSYLGKGKLSIVDVQNASLAGGVAMGSSANMLVMPYGALIIGTMAGTLSTIGYNRIQPALEATIGLHDTCGVHNLHGMPGLLGGIASVIFSSYADKSKYLATGYSWSSVWPDADRDNYTWAALVGLQVATFCMTLATAIGGGVVASFVLRQLPDLDTFYQDEVEYIVEGAEEEGEHHHDNDEGSNEHRMEEIVSVGVSKTESPRHEASSS